jgi:hypothetical protein
MTHYAGSSGDAIQIERDQVRLRRRSLRRVHGMPMLRVLRDLLGMSGDASTV